MKYNFIVIPFLFLLILTTQSSFKQASISLEDTCLSKEETKLYELIMKYRKEKKLSKIPLSKSLTYVAQTHARDVVENAPNKENCNMHSWSNKGKWSACCYTDDHAHSEGMWNKPKELTNYTSNGYEISYWHSISATPEEAIEGWKKSKGHNEVITNKGRWKNFQFNAIGIGMYKNYACVWFGTEKDNEGEPKKCK